jgi:cytochrome subunit of sulfide dehydrogenase
MRLRGPTSLILALASCAAVHAQDAATLQTAALAATCANCHGTQGRTQGSALPVLAGMPKDAMLAQLRAFKAGTRPATIMHQLSKGYTDAQLEQIAGYFAAR